MALKYFPLSRVSTNKYTRGNEFVQLDGTPYVGKYYATYNNKFFTGINPALGANEEIIPANTSTGRSRNDAALVRSVDNITVVSVSSAAYDQSTGQLSGNLTELNPYVPVPLPSDYQRGYFTRYFAKKVSGAGYIIEISQQDWAQVGNGNLDKGLLSYETADMLWQLTGPMYNTRISQYQIQGGVYDTNKRVTEAEEKTFRGIISYIGGNYTKFAKITDMTVAISGSM